MHPEADNDRVTHGLQAANHRHYHDGARVRGYLTDRYHQLRRDEAVRLLLAAAPVAGAPVLELGCGPESTLRGDQHRPVLIADIAVDALRNALTGRSAAMSGVCLDATRPLPFRDGAFGAIMMGELIEHVYDPLALLAECHRSLVAGGVLVLTTPNLAGLQDRWRFLRGRAPRQVNPLHPYLSLHIRPFTATLLADTLRHAGFEPLALRSNFVMWRLPTGRWLRWRGGAKLAPGLGGSLIMSARKAGKPESSERWTDGVRVNSANGR
jgi:SAM-dependent methyltransferase